MPSASFSNGHKLLCGTSGRRQSQRNEQPPRALARRSLPVTAARQSADAADRRQAAKPEYPAPTMPAYRYFVSRFGYDRKSRRLSGPRYSATEAPAASDIPRRRSPFCRFRRSHGKPRTFAGINPALPRCQRGRCQSDWFAPCPWRVHSHVIAKLRRSPRSPMARSVRSIGPE